MKVKLRDIEMIPIIFFISCYCLPIVFINVHWGIMLSLVLLYTFVTAIFSMRKKVIGAVLFSTFFLLLIVGLQYLIGDVSTGAEVLSKLWSLTMCVFPVYLLYRILAMGDKGRVSFLIYVVLAMFAVTAVLTAVELNDNPSACRIFALQTELYQRNVGHFDFIYAIPPMLVVLLLLYNKAKAGKVVYLALIILSLVVLFMSGYTFALLTVLVTWAIIFVKRKNANEMTIVLVAVVCIIIALVFPYALKALAQWVPHKSMSVRLTEMYNAMFLDDTSGYNMNGRLEIYKKGIECFIDGFFTGNGQLDFNTHSAFLSVAAHTGIWGVVCLYILMRNQRKTCRKMIGGKTTAFSAGYVAFLITGFTNPVLNCYLHCFSVFCLIPMTVCLKEDFYVRSEKNGE